MPCHGLCPAYVHISGRDLALFIYISFQGTVPISFLLCLPGSPHFCGYCHSGVRGTSVRPRPRESCIMVFAVHWPPGRECARVLRSPGRRADSVCTRFPSCMHSLGYSGCLYGFRGVPTGVHPDTLPGPASGCPQNAGDSHCHHVGHVFSRLACDGKEGFWLLENTATEDR